MTATTSTSGLAIVGDVTVGFPASRTGYGQTTYGNTEPQTERATWLRLYEDGTATVYAGKVEYGQGIRTGFAVEVADELRLPLDAVEVILGDTARVPWDMGTFGSQSTARVGPQLRRAAATAREALLALAADHLDLPVADLAAREGVVASETGASVTYAELLAGREIELEIDDDAALTSSDEFTVMGKRAERVDAVARVTGETTFTRDVLRDGMAFAAVVRPPSYGARLLEVDSSIAEQLPGVIDVVRDGDLVAVLGESDEAAERAASLVDAQWEEATGQPGRWDMPQLLIDSAQDHFVTQEAGDLDEGFGEADQILEAMYYIPYISITPMEPRAAVAEWDGDALTVWAGAQRPFGLRSELASRFDLEESSVHVLTPDIGGGFGGKSIFAPAAEAARLARVAGRPVRVAYTRAEEQTWATFRPAALIQIKSGFRNDGTLTAWQCDAFHAGERAMIGRRGSDSPYTTPHARVTVARSDSPLAAGSYRSLGGAVNHFAREVHMDEIAEAVDADPVELRMRHLAEPRYRRVLERAAEDFGWDGRAGSGVGIGLDVGSYSAVCLQVHAQPAEVRVERVASALDCGLVVNPDGAVNQMEGAIVMGIGNALFEAIDFEQGRLLNANLARYRVPRIVDTPSISVALVGDAETASTGAGEPGIVPTAPAISNAVFSATGERHRELPIQRQLRR